MPEQNPAHIKEHLKCARCFKQIEQKYKNTFCFCSVTCLKQGRASLTKADVQILDGGRAWKERNADKHRAVSLAYYHRTKKLNGRPPGRPSKKATLAHPADAPSSQSLPQ